MSRNNLDDIVKSPFQYCLGKKHYYLIEEYDVLCDFADTYKETKRIELTEEELKNFVKSSELTINRIDDEFVSMSDKIRKVLNNGKN